MRKYKQIVAAPPTECAYTHTHAGRYIPLYVHIHTCATLKRLSIRYRPIPLPFRMLPKTFIYTILSDTVTVSRWCISLYCIYASSPSFWNHLHQCVSLSLYCAYTLFSTFSICICMSPYLASTRYGRPWRRPPCSPEPRTRRGRRRGRRENTAH